MSLAQERSLVGRYLTWYGSQNIPASIVYMVEISLCIHHDKEYSLSYLEVRWESPVGCRSHFEWAELLWSWEHL